MAPSLRLVAVLRQRSLPDLDTATTDELLDLARDASYDEDSLYELCRSPMHVRAILSLVEDRDLATREASS